VSDHIHLTRSRTGALQLDAVGAITIEPAGPGGAQQILIVTEDGEQITIEVRALHESGRVMMLVTEHQQPITTEALYTTEEAPPALVALPGGRHA
tara:strand:+ start:2515 stop:2799 length:285 start_codon:yes stop_codon:yes gene_type:complete